MFYLKFAKRRFFLLKFRAICENFAKKSAPICKFYFFLRVLIKNRLLRRPRIDYNKAYFNGAFWEGGRTLFRRFSRNFRAL